MEQLRHDARCLNTVTMQDQVHASGNTPNKLTLGHSVLTATLRLTSGVTRVTTTAASVSAKLYMMAAICAADLPGPQMTSGKPVLAALQVST